MYEDKNLGSKMGARHVPGGWAASLQRGQSDLSKRPDPQCRRDLRGAARPRFKRQHPCDLFRENDCQTVGFAAHNQRHHCFDGQAAQLPPITGSIDESGLFTATDGGAAAVMTDSTCGVVATTSATLNFSGRTARYVEQVSTTLCGNWTLSGTLTR